MANSRKAPAAEVPGNSLAAIAELELRPFVVSGETVTVALSGGVDSIVLLDVLRTIANALSIEVAALHVHHGLSPNADAWEAHCRIHCARRRIPFRSVRVTVGGGANVEEEARHARYRVFEQHGTRVIALAHNRDDQTETVLLRLLRGAGVHGLAGMRSIRPLQPEAAPSATPGRLIARPLLTVPRRAIEAYARKRRLRWIEDESNADVRYARNFLRNEILPALDRRFLGSSRNLARAATHLADADDLLRDLSQEDLRRASVEQGLDVAVLQSLGHARAAQALRLALEGRGEPPLSTQATRALLSQLLGAREDRAPSFPLTRTIVRRFRQTIVIDACSEPNVVWSVLEWNGGPTQRLPDGTSVGVRGTRGQGLSREKLAADRVTLRRRVGGESIRLRSGGPRRTLKNLLQEHAMPPWQRERMPLLFCGEQLVWVPTVGVASEYAAAAGEAGWEFVWPAPTT